MKSIAAEHPLPADLAAYGLGKLDEEQSLSIEAHLSECAACAAVLREQPVDSLVEMLRDTARPVNQPTLLPGTVVVQPREVTGPAATSTNECAPPELRNHPRYELLERLGAGGMGQVFRAQHRIMNRPVALKIISCELIDHPGAVERFHREVQAASRLLHPNIVTAYDAEQAGETHFLVMEYVDGVDLHQLVEERGALPVEEAAGYIRDAARGLQHAHEQGMVHRDIKPHNLIVSGVSRAQASGEDCASGTVKILDFGLANFASATAADEVDQEGGEPGPRGAAVVQQLTMMGTTMGTPDYIAPEQAEDAHGADIRSDIYSLGCTFYTLLSGEAPYGEGSVLDKIRAHTERTPRPLSEFRSDVPPEVQAIVNRMMAKNPAERYQTPADVVAALNGVLCEKLGGGRVARRRRNGHSTFNWRGWLLAGLAGAAAIAAGIVFYIQTATGMVRVEVNDPSIEVQLKGEEATFTNVDGKTVRVRPGEHALVVSRDDLTFTTPEFAIRRGENPLLKVEWLAGTLRVQRGDELLLERSTGTVLREFSVRDKPISDEGLSPDGDAWRIEATGDRTVHLYEVKPPKVDGSMLTFRAQVQARDVTGRAYLEMWVHLPEQGEFFSKGFQHAVSGTTGWSSVEVPFYLQQGQQPDLVKLNVVIEGGGTVGLRNIQLRKSPLPAGFQAAPTRRPMAGGEQSASRPRVGESDPQRTERMTRLKRIGIALHTHHDVHHRFPPAAPEGTDGKGFDKEGRPLLSWRVHILPYIEKKSLYEKFRLDEPWDSEHNKALLKEMPSLYLTDATQPTKTTFQAVVGEGTAYTGRDGFRFADFKDGTSRTIYVVDAGVDKAVPWTKPEDLPLIAEDPIKAFGTPSFAGEFLVLFADGRVVGIPADIAPGALKAALTRAAMDYYDLKDRRTDDPAGAMIERGPDDPSLARLSPKEQQIVSTIATYMDALQAGGEEADAALATFDMAFYEAWHSPQFDFPVNSESASEASQERLGLMVGELAERLQRSPEAARRLRKLLQDYRVQVPARELEVWQVATGSNDPSVGRVYGLLRFLESYGPTVTDPLGLVSQAAGIPNEDWEQMVGSASRGPGTLPESLPLSAWLLTINPVAKAASNSDALKDFRYLTGDSLPRPARIAEVLEKSRQRGYASFVQPELVTEHAVNVRGNVLEGEIAFEARDLYAGRVKYTGRRIEGQWVVDQFLLPHYGVRLFRDDEGHWQRSEMTEDRISG